MVFGLGSGGLSIQITIQPTIESISRHDVVVLDHVPSWKLIKGYHNNSGGNGGRGIYYKKDMNDKLLVQQQQQQQQQQPMQMQYDGSTMMIPSTNPPLPPPHINPQGGYNNYNYNNPYNNTTGIQQEAKIYAFNGSCQDVQGYVNLLLQPGKKYDHNGIKIQFLGRIDMSHAIFEGRPHYDFISMTKEVYPPGTLYQPQTTIPFYFQTDHHKPYETYHGKNVSVKYFIRVVIERKFLPPMTYDEEIIVHIPNPEPTLNESIKMEVGIEECLHIEFTYSKRFYHLNDYIMGHIHFLLVRIKIKYMELAVIRRESSGEGVALSAIANHMSGAGGGGNGNETGGSIVTETQTLTKFEIMDGAPVKGEVIPVKLYLGGIGADLTPTFDAGINRFTVKYYLNLVLVDEDDRRYFKQQEIILWRKDIG